MRVRSFGGILDECLESVRRGDTVEACLERYPKHAERLRPILTLAARIQAAPSAQPRPWAQATAWDIVRQRAAELRSGKRRRGSASLGLGLGALLRPVAVAAALVFAIMIGGGATALASQSALPDSPLYQVKLFTEDARLWFVFDDSQEADILLDQSDERMDEILSLARKGKPIPSNVLSAMEDRHGRAAGIIEGLDAGDSDRDELMTRLLDQSASQEDALLALWDNIAPGGRDDYTEVVASLHNTRLRGTTDLVLTPNDLSGGIQQISGELRQEDGVWTIAGDFEVTIDGRTIGGLELQSGSTATGIFARNGTQLQALSLFSIARPPAFVSGEIEEVTRDGIWISGQFFRFDDDAFIPNLKFGDHVEIEVESAEDGAVARSVSQTEIADTPTSNFALTLAGTIESTVGESSELIVSGVRFVLPNNTKIDASAGPAEEGARALVEATLEEGGLTAKNVTILSGEADPDEVFFVGAYGGIQNGAWTVSGVPTTPPSDLDAPAEGSLVAVEGRRNNETLEIVVEELFVIEEPGDRPLGRVLSTVRELDGNHWDVGIGQTRVNPSATVSGEPEEGSWVLMWGRKSDEGVYQANYVRVLD